MKNLNSKEGELVLNKLRRAVALQIAAWDAAEEISEAVGCSLPKVVDFVADAATVAAEDGMDLFPGDLDELLELLFLEETVTGTSLEDQRRKVD